MIDTDTSLLDRLKAENAHTAWRDFYDAYSMPILRYGRKLGLSERHAADVLQESMVVLMSLLPQFCYDPTRGRFRNFLLTIVHRKSLNLMRRVQTREARHVSLNALAGEGTELADSAHVRCLPLSAEAQAATVVDLQRWRESLVEDAIGQLRDDPSIEERTWQVFEAYALKHEPVDVVAQRHGLKENAVYQIKNRLIRRIRTHVDRLMRDSGSDPTVPTAVERSVPDER